MRLNLLSKKAAQFLSEVSAAEANLSQAGLKEGAIKAKSEQWSVENTDSLASSNEWVNANGLPLDQYRQF